MHKNIKKVAWIHEELGLCSYTLMQNQPTSAYILLTGTRGFKNNIIEWHGKKHKTELKNRKWNESESVTHLR